jgi:membrane-associated protease RseP (regulator of RpoE activity)
MLRALTQFALVIGLVGTASAQTTEIIIRRSGQKDQVIRIDDKQAKEMAAKVSDQLQGVMKNLKELEVSRDGNVAHFTFDTSKMAERVKIFTDRATEMASRQAEIAGRTSDMATRNLELSTRAGVMARLQPGMIERTLKTALSQPRLGIFVDNSRPQDSDKFGALVSAVTPGGPADRAGIRSGDIITKVDGKSLAAGSGSKSATTDESLPGMRLIEIVTKLQAGKPVAVEYRRDATPHTVKITPVEEEDINLVLSPSIAADSARAQRNFMVGRLTTHAMLGNGERSPEPMTRFGNPSPGGNFAYAFTVGGPLSNLEMVSLNDKLGAYFGTNEGVLVVNVGEKDAFGLVPGDVIVSVDGRKVTSSTQLMRIFRTYDKGEEFKIQIMRQKKAETLSGKLP